MMLQLAAVNAALAALLILPALGLSLLLFRQRGWPEVVLAALVLGTGTQAVVGLLWSHLVGRMPGLEALLYLVVWAGITVYCRYSGQLQQPTRPEAGQSFSLLLILAAAFIVRSIHPMETAALGQSDAYTHLHYLHNIVDQGELHNKIYPAGYHWLLALPALVFALDPYLIVRYSGTIFGTGLVLAVFVLMDNFIDRRSALFAAFCAAAFPGMTLLMKTGVGAFANQFGLFLVPCLLYYYNRVIQRDQRTGNYQLVFITGLLGFAAAVPMMLLHVFIIFALERCLALSTGKQWLRRTSLLILFCLPALLLIGFHFSQAGAGQRFKTAEILMEHGGEEKESTEKIITKVQRSAQQKSMFGAELVKTISKSPYFHLVVDLFMVKRMGFSNLPLNLISFLLLLLSISCMGYGILRSQPGLLLLGIWGGLTTVQATSGFLQFSSYQREGWSLLIATCCLSGLIAGQVYGRMAGGKILQAAVAVILFASAGWTVQHPPRHPAILSSAEGKIIDTARFFSRELRTIQAACGDSSGSECTIARRLDSHLPLTLVTRQFTGWKNQGELVPNVIPSAALVETLQEDPKGEKLQGKFTVDKQYLVLLDREKKIQAKEITSAFAMVAPSQVDATLRQQQYLYRANGWIWYEISRLAGEIWDVSRVILSDNLAAYVIVPKKDLD